MMYKVNTEKVTVAMHLPTYKVGSSMDSTQGYHCTFADYTI